MSGSTISSNELANRFNGRFRMRHKIGEGGLGKVLIVEDLWLKQDTALKISDMTDTGMDMREEVLALRRLPKDRYVSVFDYVKDGNYCGYTMEVLGSPPWVTLEKFHESTIKRLLRKKNEYFTAVKYVIFIVYDLLVSLEKLHQRKYKKVDRWVHGDIKPSNLWVNKKDVKRVVIKDYRGDNPFLPSNDEFSPFTKIGDLGLTVKVGGRFPGYTPEYASPEHINGDSASPQSDIFSLGQTLLTLIIDKTLYRDEDKRDYETIFNLIQEKIPSEYLAHKLSRIISIMLKGAPVHRKTCSDLKNMLREIANCDHGWEIVKIFSDPDNMYFKPGSKSMTKQGAVFSLFEEVKELREWANHNEERDGELKKLIEEVVYDEKKNADKSTVTILRRDGHQYSLRID